MAKQDICEYHFEVFHDSARKLNPCLHPATRNPIVATSLRVYKLALKLAVQLAEGIGLQFSSDKPVVLNETSVFYIFQYVLRLRSFATNYGITLPVFHFICLDKCFIGSC